MTERGTHARVVVAGATGSVGSNVVRSLVERGERVRVVVRAHARGAVEGAVERVVTDTFEDAELRRACAGAEVVISCLGASVALRWGERRSYRDVDTRLNERWVRAASAAGASRFVYVGVHEAPGYADTRYCLAHADVVATLRATTLSSTVVRPTGVFSALDDLLGMARWGVGSIVGSGQSRTNPVHPADVADAILTVVDAGPSDLDVGGPEVLTREDVLRAAFDAVGRRFRAVHVPAALFRLQSRLLAPIHPRLSDLLEFVAAVSTHDAIATSRGHRRLADYFAERARTRALPR